MTAHRSSSRAGQANLPPPFWISTTTPSRRRWTTPWPVYRMHCSNAWPTGSAREAVASTPSCVYISITDALNAAVTAGMHHCVLQLQSSLAPARRADRAVHGIQQDRKIVVAGKRSLVREELGGGQ